MGRPYLAASPLLVGMLAKGVLAVTLADGTLQSFAQAFVIGELLSIPAYLLLARKAMGITPAHWVSATWRSAVTVGAMLGGLSLFSPLMASVEHPAARLLLVAMYVLVVWPVVLLVLRHPLAEEILRAKKVLTARFARA
jgi:hypothetical protein